MTPEQEQRLDEVIKCTKTPPLIAALVKQVVQDPKLRRVTLRVPRPRSGKKQPALVLDFCGDLRSLRHVLSQNDPSEILRIEGVPMCTFIPKDLLANRGKVVLKRWREGWYWKIWFADRSKPK